MKLLALAPEIQDFILALPASYPERQITEHRLRPLVEIENRAGQIEAFLEMVGRGE
jgi:hypothetical protein